MKKTVTRNIKNYRTHDFYCLNCGKKNISIMRSRGRLKGRGHRKVLYCPHCQTTVNHYECCDELDIWEFKEQFAENAFVEEAKASIEFLKKEMISYEQM